jgi:hypothetical protein
MRIATRYKEMPRRKRRSADTTRMLAPLPGGAQARTLAKLGTGDVSRLSWLLDLLNRPVGSFATMSSSEFKELEREVAVFCEPLGSIEGGQRGRLTVDTMRELNREILADVQALLGGYSIDLPIPRVILSVTPDLKCKYMGTPDAMFRLAVARLLEEEGSRIKRCYRKGCERLFAHRKRGLYCGRKCSQIVQLKRYVERHASS